MITLELIDPNSTSDVAMLYMLLKERTPNQSISHKRMPELWEHEKFVKANPYLAWYRISAGDVPVGAIYLTKNREIGLSIFHRHTRKGYGRAAVDELMALHPGRFLANVNPKNEPSLKFWTALGGVALQYTFAL